MTEKGVLLNLNLRSKGISNISGSFDLEVKIIVPALFYFLKYIYLFFAKPLESRLNVEF